MIEKRMRKGLGQFRILQFIGAVGLILQLSACGGGGAVTGVASSGGGGGGGAGVLPTGAATARLSWDSNPEPDVIGYRVYIGTSSGNYAQPRGAGIDVSGATTYTVTGLAKGVRYFFAVTAVDASGNESPLSREVFKDIP